MLNRFIFNGKKNYSDLGLLVKSPINIPITQEIISGEPVEGRNGSLTIATGAYPDKTLDIEVGLEDNSEFWKYFDQIDDWLTNIEDNKLILLDRPNKAYRVKRVNKSNWVKELKWEGTTTLSFLCEPFLTEIEEYAINILNTNNFYYQGTYQGEVNLKIKATGNIQVVFNGEPFIVEGVNGFVEIDGKIPRCVNEDGTNHDFTATFFPTLQRGNNTIELIGSITEAIMLPNTAYVN